ncbi:MAG: hypothetical protein FJ138_09695 [Deltaproteobacteria bacterium]|nr:hypothetical protein [Deltaproteobacteria bacterium]
MVAAALLSPEGRPLLYALNQPEVSRTYHAEWAVLDGVLRALWGARNLGASESESERAALRALWGAPEALHLSGGDRGGGGDPISDAERAALRARWSDPAAPPLTLLCTLKPCKMCAGAWVTYGPARPLRVVYVEEDPGRLAQHTAFDVGAEAWRAGGMWGGRLERLR